MIESEEPSSFTLSFSFTFAALVRRRLGRRVRMRGRTTDTGPIRTVDDCLVRPSTPFLLQGRQGFFPTQLILRIVDDGSGRQEERATRRSSLNTKGGISNSSGNTQSCVPSAEYVYACNCALIPRYPASAMDIDVTESSESNTKDGTRP